MKRHLTTASVIGLGAGGTPPAGGGGPPAGGGGPPAGGGGPPAGGGVGVVAPAAGGAVVGSSALPLSSAPKT